MMIGNFLFGNILRDKKTIKLEHIKIKINDFLVIRYIDLTIESLRKLSY